MLKWETVSPLLSESLHVLMQIDLLSHHRLVGGTALSLHLGHRMSIDIDLFTDQPYGSIDYVAIEDRLQSVFPYMEKSNHGLVGMGCSYVVGKHKQQSIKLDIYYTDTFVTPVHEEDGLRMATVAEIAAMKVDVVHRGGRKKDFWDIHEIADQLSLRHMLDLHLQRHPYSHNEKEMLGQMVDFSNADEDLDPICLKGKFWELIRYDITNMVNDLVREQS